MSTGSSRVVSSFRLVLKGRDGRSFLSGLRERHQGVVLQLVRDESSNAKFFEFVGLQTIQATKDESLLAEKPEIDLLLRLAGTNQISDAIDRSGYAEETDGPGSGSCVLVAIGGATEIERVCRDLSATKFEELKASELSREEVERVELAALLSTGWVTKRASA